MAEHRIDDEWVIGRLGRVWTQHTAGFTRLLITLRQEFGGDLDALLILRAVSTGTRNEDWQEILLGDGRGRGGAHSATNTQSIAYVTGIPRESVRRKLAQMEAKGWLTRDPEGRWMPTAQAADDLRIATQATIAYLRTVLVAFHEEPAHPPAGPSPSGQAGP